MTAANFLLSNAEIKIADFQKLPTRNKRKSKSQFANALLLTIFSVSSFVFVLTPVRDLTAC
jgi:hypothetical protein